jgi:hypothetical protein
MPKFTTKSLTFPLAGVSRSRVYREQTRPYAAPWAVNVRAYGPLEERLRGGSRPGLVKVSPVNFGDSITAVSTVTYIDSEGVRQRDIVVIADGCFSILRGSAVTVPDTALSADDGTYILDDDGNRIVFPAIVSVMLSGNVLSPVFSIAERNGVLFIADSELKLFDPRLGVVETVWASKGTVPHGCPLVCLYRDRVILGGADHVWYASRQGDPTDWDFGADMNDPGRAVAGQVERAGHIGEPLTAIIPHGDSILTLASPNAMWALRGDPADGSLAVLSTEIGIVAPQAWAMAPDGLLAFVSYDGVYVATPGERPVRFSAERLPQHLQDIDPACHTITMAYDANERGFHLFVTPNAVEGVTAQGTHWWIDIEHKAMWPVIVPATMQPVAATRISGANGLSEVVFGCRDGYLRKFSRSAAADDGTAIASHVLLGPFRMTSDDISDAMLTEVHGILAANVDTVQCGVIVGDSAEECADRAVEDIEGVMRGHEPVYARARYSLTELRNKVFRPRARGVWAVIWLSSTTPWALETVAVTIAQLGRIR